MEETSQDPNALRPVNNGPRPSPGDQIYVPGRPDLPMLHGGLARVSEKSTKRTLFLDEDPGEPYAWADLRFKQLELWAKFGAQRARLASFEEVQAARAERNEQMRVEEERQAAARAAAEEAKRREWEPKRYPVLNRGLMAVPAWCQHKRAKNWAASIEADPSLPGGFQREFFNYARGTAFYFIPPRLSVGDAVEFGADYVQGTGRREPERWYGVVLDIGPDFVELQKCQDAATAAMRSAAMRSPQTAQSG